jgi:anti-sigma regulatory factor (Ser/Thr protein kinase)
MTRKNLMVDLPPTWLRESHFEELLGMHDYRALLEKGCAVTFVFAPATKLMAHVGLWFLSFVNQLVALSSGRVCLRFPSTDGLFGYLDRSGFLALLAEEVQTVPDRPFLSGAEIYRGRSATLVEVQELHPNTRGRTRLDIVRSLVEALVEQYATGRRTKRLEQAVFTVLAELIDNVYSHSETAVPGYAMLQAYEKADRVWIAVSDSGIGIPHSLRRALGRRVARWTDQDLIVEAFQDGLSRHGDMSGRGCGLPRCAKLAADFGSSLIVRTPAAHVRLLPYAADGHRALIRAASEALQGTHIGIEFPLASSPE